MALTRRDLLRATGLVGVSTIYASRWALGSTATGTQALGALRPPDAGRYPLDQGDELDAGLVIVDEAEALAGGGWRQASRHLFDNGCTEETVQRWSADGVAVERLTLSFFGVASTLAFAPALPVLAAAGATAERRVTGHAGDVPYVFSAEQRTAADGLVEVRTRLELHHAAQPVVTERTMVFSPALRLAVSGSTVVTAGSEPDALEWSVTG